VARREGDDEILGMARGGGLNLIGSACSHVALFAISLFLARRLGRGDVGLYWQSYAVLSVLNLLSLSGFGPALTRFVAVHRAQGDDGSVRGVVRVGLGLAVSVSVLLAVGLWVSTGWLAAHAFNDPRLLDPLRFVALTLPVMTITDAALGATKGFKTMKPFALIKLVFEPVTRVVLTVALVAGQMQLGGAMIALLFSNLTAALLAVAALRRLMPSTRSLAVYRPREVFGFSLASWLASISSSGLLWADTILLGLYLPSGEVGIYNIAARLVVLASFVMLPINSSLAPRIADLYQRGKTETLRRAYAAATAWIVRLSLPAFIVIVVFPDELLKLFGPGFISGATVTVVLAAGKFVDAATGPCAMMLNMSGRPTLNMANNIAGLLLNIALNIVLIPRYGIVGSAIAWAVVLVLMNIARVTQVRLTMDMLPFGGGTAKALLAAFGAAAVGVAARIAFAGAAGLVIGAPLIGLTYLGLTIALGITREDRLVIAALRHGRSTVSG
jgi:O-antigen/teichoic acid export membrane protein